MLCTSLSCNWYDMNVEFHVSLCVFFLFNFQFFLVAFVFLLFVTPIRNISFGIIIHMEWKCRRNPSVNYFVRECVIARIWLLFGFVSSSFFVSRFHWVIEMQQAGCLLCLFFFSCFISVVLFHSIWISASHMCCICVCCVHAVWLINFKSTRNNQHSLPTTATTTKLTSQHHERTLLLLLHIEYLLSHVCCSSVFHLSLALTHAHTHSLTHSFDLLHRLVVCYAMGCAMTITVCAAVCLAIAYMRFNQKFSVWSTARNKSDLIILHDLLNAFLSDY